jgi:hypothetical protein
MVEEGPHNVWLGFVYEMTEVPSSTDNSSSEGNKAG